MCKLDNVKKEAKDKGLTLLEKGENSGCYLYQFDKGSQIKES